MKKLHLVIVLVLVLVLDLHAAPQSLSIDRDTGALIFGTAPAQFANFTPAQFKIGGVQLVQTGTTVSITGGGTFALGGFTFTVPATGTGVLTSRQVLAGTGLSGGGTLASDVTLSLPSVGTSGLKTFATGDSITTDAQGRVSASSTVTRTLSVSGLGLTGGGTLAADRTFTLTSSSNPGAAAAILATDSSGFLTIPRLTLTDYLLVTGSTANVFLKDTSTGFKSSATTIINPQSGNSFRSTSYTSGLVGWSIDAQGNAEFDNVDIRGALHASVLVYGQVQATAGTILTSKSAAKLKTDVAIPSSPTYGTTTVNVDAVDADGLSHASSQLFVVNDILYLKDGLIGATWLKVSSVSDQTTFWRYVCTIQAGTNNVTYRAGLGVADYGGSGSGFIVQTADATNAPYMQMATHAATFTSANSSGTLIVTPRLRIGNLNGWGPYASNIYGLAAGDYAGGNWFATDPTNGLRVFAGGGDVHLDANGLSFVTPTSSKTSASLSWISGTDITSFLYHSSDTSTAVTGINVVVPAANTAAESKVAFLATNSSSDIVSFTMFQRANPSPGFFEIGGTNFIGGKIGATTGFAPTRMLEVYGDGWFQSNLSAPQLRAEGMGTTFATGAGVEFKYGNVLADGTNRGAILAYDRGASAYKSLVITGLDTRFLVSGTEAGRFTTNSAFRVSAGSLVSGDGAGVFTWYTGGVGNIAAVDAGVVGKQLDIQGHPVRILSSDTGALWVAVSTAGAVRFATYGAGTLSTDASGNITASSDESLKNIEGTFDRGLADLRGLKPKKGHWNAASGLDTTEQYAWLTADDLLQHIPEAVFIDTRGKKTVDYNAVISTLVTSVNELADELDALAAGKSLASPPASPPIDRKKLALDRVTQLQARLQQRKAADPKPLPVDAKLSKK